jgi:anti-sigma factor RsiW
MTDPPRRDRLPEDLMSAYVDGEATETERAAIEARLARDAAWQHILADVVAGVAIAMPQRNHAVSPKIATLTNQHAVASSSGSDPITNLAPAAVTVGLTP